MSHSVSVLLINGNRAIKAPDGVLCTLTASVPPFVPFVELRCNLARSEIDFRRGDQVPVTIRIDGPQPTRERIFNQLASVKAIRFPDDRLDQEIGLPCQSLVAVTVRLPS